MLILVNREGVSMNSGGRSTERLMQEAGVTQARFAAKTAPQPVWILHYFFPQKMMPLASIRGRRPAPSVAQR